ncbi:MAG: radical SAM family heme chaperone HemW [Caulobacterales bacterium]|nr:radical SAM family heme chaperone HemW [Caulobacterales bacterium]
MTGPGPFGLYVHWPYCAAICPYCDFNVYRDRRSHDRALLDAIAADIRAWGARTGPRLLHSIHFGGGTPSRLAADDVHVLIEAAAAAWTLAPNAEVTLEINPEDAGPQRFAAFRAAGVTRASLGVQALDDASLKALGRAHSAAEARRAAELAQAAFPRVSLDLIYAREGQTLAHWRSELAEALAFGVDHLSLYQLTIEEGTAFARRAARGALVPPEADAAAALYELTAQLCDAAGLPAYEVSNHAKGPAVQSAHNLLYWRSHEWAGVGPGAHARLGALGAGRRALSAHRRPADYAAAVARAGWGVAEDEALSPTDQARELLLMGLRLAEGVDLERYRAVAGAPPDPDQLAALQDDGLLEVADARLRVTPAGRLLADRLAAELAPE